MPIIDGVAIGLGRYPVHVGRTIGKTRTFAVVAVDTRTEQWVRTEGGKYRGGARIKARCAPDFKVFGQPVKVRVPDTYPGIEQLIKAAGQEDEFGQQGRLSKISYIPYVLDS